MLKIPTKGLYVSGTDTDVGKTYVACLVAKSLCEQGHRVGVYKPVASGGSRVDEEIVAADALALQEAAGLSRCLAAICPQVFEAPLAPPVAAAAEGRAVDREMLRQGLMYWSDKCDVVIVEGVGGLMSPLSEEDYNATLAEEFGYPLVLVAANRLGVIHHAVQTLIAAAAFGEGIDTAGIILNQVQSAVDGSVSANYRELEKRIRVPILAEVAWQATRFSEPIDWYALANQNR